MVISFLVILWLRVACPWLYVLKSAVSPDNVVSEGSGTQEYWRRIRKIKIAAVT